MSLEYILKEKGLSVAKIHQTPPKKPLWAGKPNNVFTESAAEAQSDVIQKCEREKKTESTYNQTKVATDGEIWGRVFQTIIC